MRKQILMAGLAATAALAFAAAPVAEAQAQTYPSYCGGKLQAASFYSTTNSNGRVSTVNYYLILQNTTNQNVTYAVTFNATQARNRPNGTQFSTLRAWGTSPTILLGTDTLNNPGGTGALSNVNDLPPATRVTCR
jgi:hypothetical protein